MMAWCERAVGRGVLLLLLLGLGASVARCSSRADWVAEVEAAHVQADTARSEVEARAASDALERALRGVPEEGTASVVWVRQDLCVRLGDLALQRADAATALDWADRGLALGARVNVARADLLRIRGEALERLGEKARAAAALHEALRVNQELMERALEGEPVLERKP